MSWLLLQSQKNQQSLTQIQQGVSTLGHEEIQLSQQLSSLSQHTSQWQQQAGHNNSLTLDTVQQLSQHVDQALQQLQQRVSHLDSLMPQQGHAAPPQPTTRQAAVGYHIYAVEPYGVVIGTPSGQFHIVRVGEEIPKLGQIKSISATQVLVGEHYVIHAH